MKPIYQWIPLLLPALFASGLSAQGQGKAPNKEIQNLKKAMEQLREETDQALEEMENRLLKEGQEIGKLRPGATRFLFSGYSSFRFTDEEGSPSTFDATFNPIVLFKFKDNLFFEGEVEFELADASTPGEPEFETEAGLEYAHMVWAPRDEVMFGVGKFLLPFGQFTERVHPAWINKLPDKPLIFSHSGFIPEADVGIDVRGALPVMQRASVNYALYLTNGPQLDTTTGEIATGSPSDNNHNKTLGGRIGFLPIPSLEVGFSFMTGKAGFTTSSGTTSLDTLLLGVDVAFTRSFDQIKGTIDARAEWAMSDIDSNSAVIGGADNSRDGWYAQVSYRADKMESLLKNLEWVLRYDTLSNPASLNSDRSRLTLGVNYWIGNSTVVKMAYQFDDRDNSAAETDAFLFQVGMGF
ncbi:MAG TPA: hypothetical protein ENK02_02810 [Planctomycetes bacterium]|nr:hypothetical protein [Planctomycetota bacterium]